MNGDWTREMRVKKGSVPVVALGYLRDGWCKGREKISGQVCMYTRRLWVTVRDKGDTGWGQGIQSEDFPQHAEGRKRRKTWM